MFIFGLIKDSGIQIKKGSSGLNNKELDKIIQKNNFE